jgi:hypothetical protein
MHALAGNDVGGGAGGQGGAVVEVTPGGNGDDEQRQYGEQIDLPGIVPCRAYPWSSQSHAVSSHRKHRINATWWPAVPKERHSRQSSRIRTTKSYADHVCSRLTNCLGRFVLEEEMRRNIVAMQLISLDH